MSGSSMYKTKLCILFNKTGDCSRPNCTFAHGNAELRRPGESSFTGRRHNMDSDLRDRRHNMDSDLRDRLGRQFSPERRPSLDRSGRRVQRFSGHDNSMPFENRRDKDYRENRRFDERRDYAGGLKVGNRIEDRAEDGRNKFHGYNNVLEEQLKDVEMDVKMLTDDKLRLEASVERKAHEVDILTSRIQELETQLDREKDECRRITSSSKKFVKEYNRFLRAQDDLKRSEARLQKLGNQLSTYLAGSEGNNRDVGLDIVSDEETNGRNLRTACAKLQNPSSLVIFRRRPVNLNWVQFETKGSFVCKAIGDSSTPDEDIQNTQSDDNVVVVTATTQSDIPHDSEYSISRFRSMVTTLPPVVFLMKKCSVNSIWIGVCITATVLVAAIRAYVVRKSRDNQRAGSVADLVRRGQLRSGDRRGISKSLNYEDPFNNPFVKLDKGSSTVEMCGKVYRLAPVTLTEKEQTIHQKRRSRAYQWKRPTIFLKEGDSIPPDVDPDTVRWIPANHPFATTVSDIDQDLAQNNVYQKQGVPFRIRAEHEAMQKKLEALQNEEKLNNLSIDSQNARDFQRPYKFSAKLEGENIQKNSQENHTGNSSSEETHKS